MHNTSPIAETFYGAELDLRTIVQIGPCMIYHEDARWSVGFDISVQGLWTPIAYRRSFEQGEFIESDAGVHVVIRLRPDYTESAMLPFPGMRQHHQYTVMAIHNADSDRAHLINQWKFFASLERAARR